MKQNYKKLKNVLALTVLATAFAGSLQAQITTQTFTYTGTLQSFTVPQLCSSQVTIEAIGAGGGSVTVNCAGSGGLGVSMKGVFTATPGQVLSILVGGAGVSNGSDSGGGGGSYVVATSNTPWIIGAGGGGASNNIGSCGSNLNGVNGSTTTSGTAGANSGGTAGTGGNGGSSTGGGGGGGGGFLTNGSVGGFGSAYVNGGAGGIGGNNNHGGYGGGGSGWFTGGNGGGGGGYSGGGTSSSNPYSGGGGGGSYNAGSSQVNTAGVRSGNGIVYITYNPGQGIAITNSNLVICNGGSSNLIAGNMVTYTWSTGPNTSSITVSPNVTTSYTVTGTSTAGCISNAVLVVTVNPLPTITGTSNPALLCVGANATLTALGALSYTWSGGPSTSTLSTNPIISTTYSVTGTSTAGCVNSGTVLLNVNTLTLSVTTDTAICLGKTAHLSATGGTAFSWSNGVPLPAIQVNPTSTTLYTVSGIDVNGCTHTGAVTVTVNPNPVVLASASRTNICKGESVTLTGGGASTYVWSSPVSSTLAVVTVTPSSDITYNYSVTGTNATDCSSSAEVSVKVGKCSGISELNQSGINISVYPNPNKGEFIVSSETDIQLKVVNELGQVVRNITLSQTNGREVTVNNLGGGVYFITGSNENSTVNRKVIVNQ